LRDWLFAKQSKRLLLEALLRAPERGWTRSQLARVSGQHLKARMDLHLAPLLESGLLERRGDVYRLIPDQPIAATLRHLLEELNAHTRK
jgi:hypothetical protein